MDNAAGHLEANNGDNSRVNYLYPRYNKGLGSYNQPCRAASCTAGATPAAGSRSAAITAACTSGARSPSPRTQRPIKTWPRPGISHPVEQIARVAGMFMRLNSTAADGVEDSAGLFSCSINALDR